ncbi:uncharacterized protein GGS22DRAFT_157986 [Annulohypoxylon maeteangense]|uniref:uncharacterized protein n=1 Tax=Annulohypoxylon maeteangense TaxID=1927788 RepID=UPI002007F376|nr:uncharacterized protein GGS22DRAFT_157986 [Annulohypoxylon maeteangense]KAI0886493.1 hypothetical protein GGS22DRAFT_157986 [Annulohypoxylon maeteangense]
MPSLTTLLTPLTALLALAKALPTKPASIAVRNTTCTGTGSTTRVYASELYTLFPTDPDLSSPAVQDFHVQYNNQTNLTISQAAHFSGLPSGATGCAFGWSQDDASVGVLVAGGDGLLAGRQLSGFPDTTEGVSAAAVAPFDTAGADGEFHTEFTGWDREVKGTYHSSGPGKITCAEDVFVIIEKPRTTNGNVFLKRTAGAGLFIDYIC